MPIVDSRPGTSTQVPQTCSSDTAAALPVQYLLPSSHVSHLPFREWSKYGAKGWRLGAVLLVITCSSHGGGVNGCLPPLTWEGQCR